MGALAGPVVALKVEAGAIGFFVVVLLCIASAGIFAMMSRSLKRMKSNVASGEFHGEDPRPSRTPTPGPPVTVPERRAAPPGDTAGSD